MSQKIIKEKKYQPRWEKWSEEGNLQPLGYEIVEGNTGHRQDELGVAEYFVTTYAHGTLYHHSYGKLTPFYQGLLEKRLWGTKCPECGLTYMPPRAHCWRPECQFRETEWVELPLTGTVHTYSIMGFSSTPFLPQLPFILGFIRIDTCNTTIAGRIVGVNPVDVQCQMRVQVNFVDEPLGSPMDLYYTPIGEYESKMTAKKRQSLEAQLALINAWVKEHYGSSQ